MRRVLLATLLLLGSCTRPVTPSAHTLRIAGVGGLENLSPKVDSSFSVLAKGLVFSLILEPAPEGGWQSQVLHEWVRLGPRQYKLKLEPLLRFSDGSLVRNEDLVASLAAFGLRGSESGTWIEVKPMQANARIDTLFLRAVLFKDHPEGPLGTGPFALVAQDTERIVLRRVKAAPARIAQVEIVAYSTRREAFLGALRGEVDAIPMLDPSEVELLDGVARFNVVRAPSVQSIGVVFNANVLSRAHRAALTDAIDVAELRQAHGGDCEVESQLQRSRSSPPPIPLRLFAMGTDPSIVRVFLALRRSLGATGGPADISQEELASQMADGFIDLAVSPLLVWPPLVGALRWHTQSPLNITGYSNTAVDDALDAGDYRRAQQELVNDPPAIFICHRPRSAAIDSRVRNPKLGPYDLLGSLSDWEVNP